MNADRQSGYYVLLSDQFEPLVQLHKLTSTRCRYGELNVTFTANSCVENDLVFGPTSSTPISPILDVCGGRSTKYLVEVE